MRPTPQPVTLADLEHEGKLLWVYCCECGKEREIEPGSLPLPRGTPVPGLGRKHLVCSSCGSKRIDTKPQLYPTPLDT
jgi:hypothetical protein